MSGGGDPAAVLSAADADFMNKFSRQNAALGVEVTMKLTQMKVLIVGCGGVSVEIVKNLVLQGCGGVTLVDETPVKIQDLGVNFFVTQVDVGKPLAPTLVPRFKELNPYCAITAAPALSAELVTAHSALLIAESMPYTKLCQWNDLCRRAGLSFFYCRTGGVFANAFVDHGPRHIITDPNGDPPKVRLIESIETGPEALVRMTVPDGQTPGSLEGYVELTEIKGCGGIMEHQEEGPAGDMVKAWKITSKSGDPVNTCRIGDTSGFPPYVSGGIVTEKNVATPKEFKVLAEAMKSPGMPHMDMVGCDLNNFGIESQIHLALHAALVIEDERPLNAANDLPALVAKAKELLKSGASEVEAEVDEDVFAKFLRHYTTPLQPLCAFLGGVMAQEIVKCAGKYTPIPGFLHFNCLEALPDEIPGDCAPAGTRYDHLAAVYGHSFVQKLGNQKYFMVGCGALGCEFMKNFALNGICCGENGKLIVTDNDRIELSNLTRQFLFREHNVGQPKSRAASEMARVMNPGLQNVEALEMFVGPKTEDHFNDKFWMDLDGVCNALDNMEARFYVDDQVVKYEKFLLESGTMGPAGNVDPIVPFKTQTYHDGGRADEGGGIPMCTLRNFPHLPDHCIEWSRDQFELLFVKSVKQAGKFYEDPSKFVGDRMESGDDAQAIFEVRGLLSLLTAAAAPSMKSAAQMAFDYFHFLFDNKIRDLVAAFPEDARVVDKDTKQDKGPFWTGHKRFPRAAVFDAKNQTHWEFQLAATAIFASMLGAVEQKREGDNGYLKDIRSQAWVEQQVKQLTPPEYVAGAINMEGDDAADSGAPKVDSKAILRALLDRLEAFKGKAMPKLEEADFEKDDDLNFHIAFITQCANLRADNYYIANSDFHKVKLIAGRIIPAIATTTAAVCGLVMLELFKILLGKSAEALRTRQVGLALNTFVSFEANPPKTYRSGSERKVPAAAELPETAFDDTGKIKEEYVVVEPYAAYPENHSVWDKISLPSGSMTLREFKAWLETDHKLTLKQWSFLLGWKRQEDEEGREMQVPFSATVYPPPVAVNGALLPPLDLALGAAIKAIMVNTAIPQPHKQTYNNAWQVAKKTGKLPSGGGEVNVTLDMSMKDVLLLMEKKADAAMQDGTLHKKWGTAISGLAGRAFWVVPADQTPACSTIPEGDAEPVDLRFMAGLKIPL